MMARSKQRIINAQFEEISRVRALSKKLAVRLLNREKIDQKEYSQIVKEIYGGKK